MPRGRYLTPLGEEQFDCAPGPAGWRYVSRLLAPGGGHGVDTDAAQRVTGSVDLTLDARGRTLRLELVAGDWRVRGAALDGLTWVRMAAASGEDAREGNAPAHAFTGASPAFLVATARLLRLSTATPSGLVRLVDLAAPALSPRTREERWTLLGSVVHPTDTGPLTVDTYGVDDLETAERHTVHLAGDVVLAAPDVELAALDSPPSDFRTAE
ncbi:hypothetical protein ACTWP5_17025 [Streptomyces sp. 4N509B]|uniref:hypothetical protein n=1 Tax=Streptomyces sp. 4N509B TaxID=3457413 RepID=UPI003FD049FF